MACMASIVSSPVLGSGRSPSLKSCSEVESGKDMHAGSPAMRSPLNNTTVSPSLSLRQQVQENLGLNSASHGLSPSRSSLQASRLRSIRDENHPPVLQWNDNSPVKHGGDHHHVGVLGQSLLFSQRAKQRFQGRIKVKEEQPERVLTEINGGFGAISPTLKRKRPPKLDIPKSPREIKIISLNEKAIVDEIKSFEGDHYGFYCKKGRKEIMEDTHNVTTNIFGDDKQAFFGVYDGHGGRRAADFVAEKLGQKIVDLMLMSGKEDCEIEQAVKAGYLETDREFLEQGVSSGACCVTALIKDGCLVVANAGDCRAVLSRNGKAESITSDHRPEREEERERIENLGGYVDIHSGTWRVQGTLAVTRSIGDLHLKQWISAEPEIRKLPITSDAEFLIMASDGLWEKVSNQEAVDIVRPFCAEEKKAAISPPELFEEREAWNENASPPPKARKISLGGVPKIMKVRGLSTMGCYEKDFKEYPKSPKLQQLPLRHPMAACKQLVELSAARGTRDDISVMIVDLRHFCRNKSPNG